MVGHETREGCAEVARVTMRSLPLKPSVELHETREVFAGVARATLEPCHRGLRWSCQWGHEPCEGRAETDMRKAEARSGRGGGRRVRRRGDARRYGFKTGTEHTGGLGKKMTPKSSFTPLFN